MEQQLKSGDYVLATKYSDGDPGDHWAVGFFVGMLPKAGGDRFKVADEDGKLFRGNGFRRAEKISAERGQWLLERAKEIESSIQSLWNWVEKPMTPNAAAQGREQSERPTEAAG